MRLSELKVLVVDDDFIKAMDIKRALEMNDIRDILTVRNQEAVWEEVEKEENGKIDLIVTDMNYPMYPGGDINPEAGFVLLDKIEQRDLNIPVIICSTRNFREAKALGIIRYHKNADLGFEFQEVLQKLMKER